MLFMFSRPSQHEPGKRVGLIRPTLDPTRGQETAFARANGPENAGLLVRVIEDPNE